MSDPCPSCNLALVPGGRIILALERRWHKECFKCCECKQMILAKSFTELNRQPLCGECAEKRGGIREDKPCGVCGQALGLESVDHPLTNQPVHGSCLKCSGCKKPLNAQAVVKDNQLFHPGCVQTSLGKPCSVCHKPLTGTTFSVDGHSYHEGCFEAEGKKIQKLQALIRGRLERQAVNIEKTMTNKPLTESSMTPARARRLSGGYLPGTPSSKSAPVPLNGIPENGSAMKIAGRFVFPPVATPDGKTPATPSSPKLGPQTTLHTHTPAPSSSVPDLFRSPSAPVNSSLSFSSPDSKSSPSHPAVSTSESSRVDSSRASSAAGSASSSQGSTSCNSSSSSSDSSTCTFTFSSTSSTGSSSAPSESCSASAPSSAASDSKEVKEIKEPTSAEAEAKEKTEEEIKLDLLRQQEMEARKKKKEKDTLWGTEVQPEEEPIYEEPPLPATIEELRHEISHVRGLLSSVEADWGLRVRALHRIEALVQFVTLPMPQSTNTDPTSWEDQITNFQSLFATQVNDLRSSIVRETCRLLIALAKLLGTGIVPCINGLLPNIVANSYVTIKIIRDSSLTCASELMKTVPSPVYITPLLGLLNDAHGQARACATKHIGEVLKGAAIPPSETKDVSEQVANALPKILEDKDQDVRKNSVFLWTEYKKRWPERAEELFATFNPRAQKALGAGASAPAAGPKRFVRPVVKKTTDDTDKADP